MDPKHLKTNELTYELKIRNLEPSGSVDSNRKILRGVLSQQNANRSFQETISNPYAHEDDSLEITETLDDLKKIITDFNGNQTEPVFKRISTRLYHVSNRINNLKTHDEDEDKAKKALHYRLLELEADLDMKTSQSTSTPTQHSPPVNPMSPSRSSIAPYKWNLSFTGASNKESVNSFLERVELLREARGVTKVELFHSACDLFKGPAWTWFVNNRSRVNSWDDLVIKLKEDFLPYFYDDDLEREINSRTQGQHERASLFISSMEGLFNRLTHKPDEQTIVNRIRRNLLPFFITNLALHKPTTIAELMDLCKQIEESRVWSDRYKPPPNYRNGLLEPDLSCPFESNSTFRPKTHLPSTPTPSRNYGAYKGNDNFRNRFNNTNVMHNVSALSNVRCWNCDEVGHRFNSCSKKRQIFCFGCGAKKVIRSSCQNCSSKNGTGGAGNLDAVTSQVSQVPDQNQPSTSQTKPNKGKSKA